MKTIDRHLYGRLEQALKCEGTYDPKSVLPHFEESLTLAEYRTLEPFLGWCHANGKGFGHGNYNERFAEWRSQATEGQ